MAKKRLAGIVDHVFYFPYDIPLSVKYVTDKIDPGAVLIMESDIWPNFLSAMKRRRIPVILCNGRLSDRSYSRFRRCLFVAKPLFSLFTGICAQSEQDAKRFIGLGLAPERVHTTGNVKFDQPVTSPSAGEVEDGRRALGLLPTESVLLAGSTHRGEESLLLEALRELRQTFPVLRLVIAPRDPRRAGSIQRLGRSQGYSSSMMTALEGTETPGGWDVLIVDTIGVLNRIYVLADVAFVGGSLARAGGHNPLEPAAHARPILFGPDMSDFRDISHRLLCSGGAVQVEDADGICREVTRFLSDPDRAHETGGNALRVFAANRGAVARTIAVVENCLR